MPADLEPLTRESFVPHVGTQFVVAALAGDSLELTLSSIDAAGAGLPGKRTPFALHFHGPTSPVLPQAVRRLTHPALGELEIFLVPLGPSGPRGHGGAMVYEAIFS